MKFFKWLRKLFFGNKGHKKPIVQIPSNNEESRIPPVVDLDPYKRIAIVVGHNSKKQGADNYLGESEYNFNSRIANKLQLKLASEGVSSFVIKRPSGVSYRKQSIVVANKVDELNASHAILLHFNSAGRGAMGVEVLIAQTATKGDNIFADNFSDMLNEEYGFIERRDDGVFTINKNHNGFQMINRINGKGIVSCLVEPCFADYKTKESQLIFEQEDKYVDVLLRSVLKSW